MHSLKSFSFLPVLAAVLILAAATACSVETREERQQRLAGQDQAVSGQVPETTAPEITVPETGVQKTPGQDPFSGLMVAPEPETDQQAVPDTDADTDADANADMNGTAPGAVQTMPDAVPGAVPDAQAQNPADTVNRFFQLALARDLEGLKQYVTRDQQPHLQQLLDDLDEAMAQEGDGRLLDVGQVDVLQTTRTAVVDVNVTLRYAGGDETRGESIKLRFEDGAWRIADLDF